MLRRDLLWLALAALLVTGLFALDARPAEAAPCLTCEEEPEGEGGGGGGGGGPAPNPAPVTVAGTFRYRDTDIDPTTGVARLRPIAFANVEIWRYAPHIGPVWTWAKDATTRTDANGSISVPMPFDTSGIIYALRITATNYAAVVWPNDALHTVPFHQEPGEPDGANIHRTATTPGETLRFSYDFTDGWTPQHFNIAETIRHGYDYVQARRDPRETDDLPPAPVQPTSVTPNSWNNALFDTVVIKSDQVTADLLILHEYAHWVQEKIGSFPWNITFHDGCTARDLGGKVVNSAGHAWMEGFADYFAQAVDTSTPGATLVGTGGGTPTKTEIERPPTCPPLDPEFTPDEREFAVAASLWDVFDEPGDAPSPVSEPTDQLSRTQTLQGTQVDRLIVQILDRELDMAVSIAGPFPTIYDFSRAWTARGLPTQLLDDILSLNGISPLSAAPGPSPPAEGPVEQVCRNKSWTEGC